MEIEDLVDSEVKAAAELAIAAVNGLPAAIMKTEDGRVFKAHRNDVSVAEITEPGQKEIYPPRQVAANVKLQTSGSLKAYLNRFKNVDSMLFADITTNSLHGVIDYHGAGHDTHGFTGILTAKHAIHSAVLILPKSKEWEVWVGNNEKLMSHEGFASFLEENALDVETPNGGDLLELCRDLQVKSGTEFKSSIRMGDTVKFEYKKDNEINELQLPSEFIISIPVYFGEPPISLRCLTRRKIDDGNLFLGYKIVRLENARQQEFQRIVSDVQFDCHNIATVYGRVS